MIPPLILDVESHHAVRDFDIYFDAGLSILKVLDMCAAPGSKVRRKWLKGCYGLIIFSILRLRN